MIEAGVSELIFALVVVELVSCLFLAGILALSEDGDIAAGILAGWLVLAVLRLSVRYLTRGRTARSGMIFLIVLMLFVSVMPGEIEAFPYFHQVLFVAGVALLPQLWWEWDADRTRQTHKVLKLTGLFVSLPLSYIAWSTANIGIIKAGAWAVARDDPHCLMIGEGGPIHGGYFHMQDGWSLSGWRMTTGRSNGGGSTDYYWYFRAVLVMQDKRLFNWSFKSQQFERVSESTTKSLALQYLQKASCR